jgi:hypothetical protein
VGAAIASKAFDEVSSHESCPWQQGASLQQGIDCLHAFPFSHSTPRLSSSKSIQHSPLDRKHCTSPDPPPPQHK